jgi:hypothetical protein
MLVNVYSYIWSYNLVTNSNVLRKLLIRDLNNRVNWKLLFSIGGFCKNTIHT